MLKGIKTALLILVLCFAVGCFSGCDVSDGFISPSPTLKPTGSPIPSLAPTSFPENTPEASVMPTGEPNNDMPDNNVPGSNEYPNYDNMPTNDANFDSNSDNSRYFRSPSQLIDPDTDNKSNMAD